MNVFVIAEAGVNHNGSLEMALKLVDAAHHAGADAVKFQTFQAARIASRTAPKADYQSRLTDGSESQYEMIRKLELDEAAHQTIFAHCKARGIEFISTPFDIESVGLLERLGVRRLKIPSGEITNGPLVWAAAKTGLPIILSTGMALLGEIEEALAVLAHGYLGQQPATRRNLRDVLASENARLLLQQKVSLLHCTTEYPAPPGEVNLRAMDTLRQAFGLPVGLSDHTEGIAVSVAAVARGAEIIEKHFTLDRNLPGPDHKASLHPDELKTLTQAVRTAELAMGDTRKIPSASERKNISIARKSLIALTTIRRGEKFTPSNLGAKRPGTGISPMEYWDTLGRTAHRDYQPDEIIHP